MTDPRPARVFRYFDDTLGAYQITPFPDDPPEAPTDIESRIRHFTEIENFTFFGHELARDIGEEKLADLPRVEFDQAMKLILAMGQEDLTKSWSAAVVDIQSKKAQPVVAAMERQNSDEIGAD